MTEAFLLIASDQHGTPTVGGGYDHVVRLSSNPEMTAVNQVKDGGNYPQDDCVVADTISFLYDWLHVSVGGLTIEHDEGTGPRGTTFVGLMRALAMFGVSSRQVAGDPPPGLWVMQPATGTDYPPSAAGPFRAASKHAYVVVTSPQPGQTPAPAPSPPPPQGEPSMSRLTACVDAAGVQHTFQVNGGGQLWHKSYRGHATPGFAAGFSNELLGDGFNPNGGVTHAIAGVQVLVFVERVSDARVVEFWQGADGHFNPVVEP